MVLTANYSKRPVDAENTPPSASKNQKLRSGAAGGSVQLHAAAAARRRRARTNGLPGSPRYKVEQAKFRRSAATATSSSVRFDIPTPDVEMQDAQPRPSTTSVQLPRLLARPEYKEVSRDKIAAVDPELADTPADYIREALEDLGPHMMDVLRSVQQPSAVPQNTRQLPKEMAILVADRTCDAPTHMLALYSNAKPAPGAKRRVTLFPTHAIVLAAHCASLPALPQRYASTSPSTTSSAPETLTLPVTPLCVPSPETFPHLSAYLYTKRVDTLLASLLPGTPPPTPASAPSSPSASGTVTPQQAALIEAYAASLAGTYTPHALLKHLARANGLWRNACALGVCDEGLWGALDLAWEVLVAALALGTGKEL